ncbi:hypothetical protein IQ255_10485 [Pleurocapsales cyanobacterium LEGE 10410]|nr:hypothetical protein [Pleurocapsales cyanobacterium LEGE 10410]
MKSIKTTAILTLVSLGAIASGVKPASAQTGINPHTGEVYDTSHCLLYNNAYVDSYGNVTCSMSPSGSSGYYYHQGGNRQTQLDQ